MICKASSSSKFGTWQDNANTYRALAMAYWQDVQLAGTGLSILASILDLGPKIFEFQKWTCLPYSSKTMDLNAFDMTLGGFRALLAHPAPALMDSRRKGGMLDTAVDGSRQVVKPQPV